MGYARSPFRDFECYLKIVVRLDKDDIQLILKQCSSNFVTYELSPGTYTFKDISEAVHKMGDHDGSLKIEYGGVRMETRLVSTPLGGIFE